MNDRTETVTDFLRSVYDFGGTIKRWRQTVNDPTETVHDFQRSVDAFEETVKG